MIINVIARTAVINKPVKAVIIHLLPQTISINRSIVGLGLGPAVGVGVGLGLAVGIGLGLGPAVGIGVGLGPAVGLAVGVGVGVGVGFNAST